MYTQSAAARLRSGDYLASISETSVRARGSQAGSVRNGRGSTEFPPTPRTVTGRGPPPAPSRHCGGRRYGPRRGYSRQGVRDRQADRPFVRLIPPGRIPCGPEPGRAVSGRRRVLPARLLVPRLQRSRIRGELYALHRRLLEIDPHASLDGPIPGLQVESLQVGAASRKCGTLQCAVDRKRWRHPSARRELHAYAAPRLDERIGCSLVDAVVVDPPRLKQRSSMTRVRLDDARGAVDHDGAEAVITRRSDCRIESLGVLAWRDCQRARAVCRQASSKQQRQCAQCACSDGGLGGDPVHCAQSTNPPHRRARCRCAGPPRGKAGPQAG